LKRRNLVDEYNQLYAAVQVDLKEIRVPLHLLYIGPTSVDDFESLKYECDDMEIPTVEELERLFWEGGWNY
jgi:hypothetical protein